MSMNLQMYFVFTYESIRNANCDTLPSFTAFVVPRPFPLSSHVLLNHHNSSLGELCNPLRSQRQM